MRLIRITSAILALAVCLLSAGQARAADKQALKYKFPPGTYKLTLTDKTNNTTVVNDQEEKHPEDELMEWKLVVPTPDGQGNKKCSLRLTKIVEKEGDKEVFNSANPDQGQAGLAFVYKPMMELEVQITLDADDTVVEVTGLDKMFADLMAKATTDEQKAAVAAHQIQGDKMIEREFRTMEALMPRNAVAAGDKWQAGLRVELPVIGEIKTRYDCNLKEVRDGKTAVIGAQGLHEITKPRTINIEGNTATLTKVAAKDDVTLLVDIATGRVTSNATNTKGEIEMTVKAGDKEVPVKMKIESVTTVTIDPMAGASSSTWTRPAW